MAGAGHWILAALGRALFTLQSPRIKYYILRLFPQMTGVPCTSSGSVLPG